MNIGFEHPLFILAGIGVVFLFMAGRRFFQDAFTVVAPLGAPGGVSFKPPRGTGVLMRIMGIMTYAGVFLLFIAAAEPVFVAHETVWLNRGADIIFVVDISPSMAALDMGERNRFDTARVLVREFAASRPSDAIGLVAVGREAALLLPPTVDRDALYQRLDTLMIGELGDGSALGMGMAIAALHVRGSTAPRRAVIIITDGEHNAGAVHPQTAAAAFPAIGADLWVIALGRNGEIPIDYVDPFTKTRRQGTFDSRYDLETLETIAKLGGGVCLPAPSGDAFAAAFTRISGEEMIISRGGTIRRTNECQTPFIIGALVLLVLVRCIRRYVLGSFL